MNVRDPDLKLNSSGDIKRTDQASEMLPYPHESATAHVTGSALYVDDVALPGNALHVEVGVSEHASARLKSVDLTKVRTSEGVVDVITSTDIPGENEVGAVLPGDRLLSLSLIHI